MKNIEVELKFKLINPEKFIPQLNSKATIIKLKDYQKDDYYVPSHRNFLSKTPISEWLRIRETPKKSTINYKDWHNKNGEKTVSCDEFETTIENSETVKEILSRLDFKKIITVEKERTVWNYRDVEIAVDNVKGVGEFIELEAKGNFENVEEAKEYLYFIAKEIGAELGEQEFKGYPYLLLEQNGLLE